MRLIISSQRDLAGSNIYEVFRRRPDFMEEEDFEGRPLLRKGDIWVAATSVGQVEAEHLDEHFDPEYYVFVSRHRSASNERTLTVHATGNLGDEALVGGRPRELALTAPEAMKAGLNALTRIKEAEGLDYKVSMETTHHGPTSLKRPVLFVEVGSTEEEWNDQAAVEVVAEAALACAENRDALPKGIGVGGGHYAPRHTQFMLHSGAALGHLIPTYAIPGLELDLFRDAAVKSGASFCFFDWKGMKKAERDKIKGFCNDLGLEILRTTSYHTENEGEAHEYAMNKGLFQEAEKADPKGLKKAIERFGGVSVIKGGHLEPIIMSGTDIRPGIIKACLDILHSKGLVLKGNVLILSEERLDAAKAVEMGVEPGPDFASLKKGKTLQIGGRIISPEDVLKVVKKEIPLDRMTLEVVRNILQA